jgi:hypothetical protein
MTVRLCGLLHELLNCGGKVPVKKLVCLLPARRNVMGARLCCSRISNCVGLFVYTAVIITRFIFCMFIVWRWKDSCTNIPHGDLRFGARPPRRLVTLFVRVRACGLPLSALSLLGNFDPAGSPNGIKAWFYSGTPNILSATDRLVGCFTLVGLCGV